jgi:amidase
LTICDMPATEILRAMRAGEVSAQSVMEAFLDRIEKLNPIHNAIISLRPRDELMAEARAADATPAVGKLHGLPMAIKDLAMTKGLRTTYGSPIFAQNVPEEDDLFVARIRAAGAIIIGKTNTPEFGLGSQTYNPIFGTTRNALNPALIAGGSSGGAAVAVALGMLPMADGSDMGGSLRNPAAFNGVYGFRPSQGRVPCISDADQFFAQLSTDGPIARNVQDLALLASVQAGPHAQAPLSLPESGEIFDVPIHAKPARIGWIANIDKHLPIEPGITSLCETTLAKFAAKGCTVERFDLDFDLEALWQAFKVLRQTSSGSGLGVYYDNPETRALLKPEAQWEVEQSLKLTAREIYAASSLRTSWYHYLLKHFERFDCLALPTAQVFAFPAEIHWPKEINGRKMDSYHRWMQIVTPGTMSGCPIISVPAGMDGQGRAMGMQLIGRPKADVELLHIAACGA